MKTLHFEHRYKSMIRQKIFNGINFIARYVLVTCSLNLGGRRHGNLGGRRHDLCHDY